MRVMLGSNMVQITWYPKKYHKVKHCSSWLLVQSHQKKNYCFIVGSCAKRLYCKLTGWGNIFSLKVALDTQGPRKMSAALTSQEIPPLQKRGAHRVTGIPPIGKRLPPEMRNKTWRLGFYGPGSKLGYKITAKNWSFLDSILINRFTWGFQSFWAIAKYQ